MREGERSTESRPPALDVHECRQSYSGSEIEESATIRSPASEAGTVE
jgi:hypothetical protein